MVVYNIKNMVCARCIRTVTGIFRQAGVEPVAASLGKIETGEELTAGQEQQVRKELEAEGFEWLDDQKVKLVEGVK